MTVTSLGFLTTTDSGYQKSEEGNPLTVGRICTDTGRSSSLELKNTLTLDIVNPFGYTEGSTKNV